MFPECPCVTFVLIVLDRFWWECLIKSCKTIRKNVTQSPFSECGERPKYRTRFSEDIHRNLRNPGRSELMVHSCMVYEWSSTNGTPDNDSELQTATRSSRQRFGAPDNDSELQTTIRSSRQQFGFPDNDSELQTKIWSSRQGFGAPDNDSELQTSQYSLL